MAPGVIYHFNSFVESMIGLAANKEFKAGLF